MIRSSTHPCLGKLCSQSRRLLRRRSVVLLGASVQRLERRLLHPQHLGRLERCRLTQLELCQRRLRRDLS